jgi:hypothetical protein
LALEPEGRNHEQNQTGRARGRSPCCGEPGIEPGSADAGTPRTLTLTAFVADQRCQPNGDFVDVRLSAMAESSSQVLGHKWDFTNDGRFDTRVLADPTLTHTYADEVTVTARIGARNAEGNKAMDTVTFATLRRP